MNVQDAIIQVAQSYIGEQEITGNLGFKDPKFQEKMIEVGWRKTQPWCCYFTELVYKEAFALAGIDNFNVLDNLFSASTQKTWNNFSNYGLTEGFIVTNNAYIGDLVVWRSSTNPSEGHIGIVTNEVKSEQFETIEGNTNDKGGREGYIVAKKLRPYDFALKYKLNLRGFIHYQR